MMFWHFFLEKKNLSFQTEIQIFRTCIYNEENPRLGTEDNEKSFEIKSDSAINISL